MHAAYAILAAGLGLLIERELRGVDVPGANDNASGVAAVATLATELQAEPLTPTRVICLFTGCEEAGVLGADAFVRELETTGEDWHTWHFVNFDGVAAPRPFASSATRASFGSGARSRAWCASPRSSPPAAQSSAPRREP